MYVSANDSKDNLSRLSQGIKSTKASNMQLATQDILEGVSVRYENTYKTKPDKKLQSGKLENICTNIMNLHLEKQKYDSEKVTELMKKIGNEILEEVKKLDFPRYKFVVDVTLGEFKGQGIRTGSRCVWDTTTDTYASASFRNSTIWGVAIVFGTYFE